VDVESPVATYETPYGFIVRETNGNEEPGQRWIDLTGRQGGDTRGLTVINDAKYGYSVSGNDMRLSVTRSTVFALHDPVQLEPGEEYVWMDQGIQTFRLLLAPHRGSWKDALIPRLAEEFMTPPIPVYQGIHQGTMPTSGSFLSVDSPNIVVSAIKQSEEGGDLILRLVETFGESVTATLRFPSVNRRWQGSFRPCEIKTLRLNTSTGNIKEVNLLEE
jgi:alpha-mannosidase